MSGRALPPLRKIFLRALLGAVLLMVAAVGALLGMGKVDPRYTISNWRVLLNAAVGLSAPGVEHGLLKQGFALPQGLAVTVFAAQVPNARLLHLTPVGDLLVSQPRRGQITRLLRDADGDGVADGQEVLIANLDRPHGIDIHDGWLYVAEGGAVGRVRFDAATGQVAGAYQRILEGIPAGENHWTRTLRVGDDDWVYLSIGSSCNACVEQHPWRAAIIRFKLDGSSPELYAHGLRNSVGFDWAPWSGELFATENGRDLMGDDVPPDELNAIQRGGFYGWPYLHGAGLPDPDAPPIAPSLAARALPPAHGFGAHTAPLGIRFLRSASLQARYGRAALVALHGSWNRTVPDGYRVALLQWQPDGRITEQVFMDGFRRQDQVFGRPVDVAESASGELFISDDYAGVVYKVAAGQQATAGSVPTLALSPADPLAGVGAEERASASAAAKVLMDKHACAACHVPGSPLADKLQGLNQRFTLADLTRFFLTPTPPMPVFPLSDTERRQLAIHLLATPEAMK